MSTVSYPLAWDLLHHALDRVEAAGHSPIVLSSLPYSAVDHDGHHHDHTGLPFVLVPSGRLIATAIGMRAMLPDPMLVLVGAADSVTLGTNHLIHAARRNMGMILLVLRSDVLDVPEGLDRAGWVETGFGDGAAPAGTPLDWATELQAGMVARGLLTDPDGLAELLVTAHRQAGFSVIGVTADESLPIGIQSRSDWPEFFTSYRQWAERLQKAPAAAVLPPRPRRRDDAPERVEVRVVGLGGQGIKLSGTVLSEAAGIHAGLWATHHGEYGSATRGGPSKVDVVYGARPITYAGADHPDVLVILSDNALTGQRAAVGPRTTLVVDDSLEGEVPAGAVRLPMIRLAREHTGKAIAAGIACLGAVAAYADGITVDQVMAAATARLPGRMAEKNLSALETTYQIAKGAVG